MPKFFRSASFRSYRCIQLLTAVILTLSLVLSLFSEPAFAQTPHPETTLPEAKVLTVSPKPLASPEVPALNLDIAINPDPVVVGEVATVNFTLANQSATTAENVQLTLPVTSDMSVENAENQPTLVRSKTNWVWNFKTLGAYSTISFSANFSLRTMPVGRALILKPVITGKHLPTSVEYKTGTVVVETANMLQGKTKETRFVPGSLASLQSSNQQVELALPANLYDKGLRIQHIPFNEKQGQLKAQNLTLPSANARSHKGLGIFYLEAFDDAGQAITKFAEPLTVKVRYTKEQLDVLGLNEANLTLYWFDEKSVQTLPNGQTQKGVWIPISTEIDYKNKMAIAKVDHFTGYQLGDGSSPSEAYLPSLQGWQESLFTGAGSYSYNFNFPAGPAGLKPNLQLTYSSGSTDGLGGANANSTVPWTGKGWSLDVGSISLNKTAAGKAFYALSLNGQSHDLMGGVLVNSNPSEWRWQTAAEAFLKIRQVSNGNSYDGSPGRGGFYDTVPVERTKWQIWTKDGTLYEFSEDLWWGWQDCSNPFAYSETYKWNLSRVVDTHGNVINYTYNTLSQAASANCYSVRLYKNDDSYPSKISWGSNLNDPNSRERFRIDFSVTPRTDHDTIPIAPFQIGNPHSKTRLDSIVVLVNQTPSASYDPNAWGLVRRYNFGYDYSTTSDTWYYDANTIITPKLTLKNIQQIGFDNVSALPATTFNYKTERGTNNQYANGGWNRLVQVNNGQGGILNIEYENVGQVNTFEKLRNHHRIKTKLVSDGRGNNYSWNYSYGTPQLNSLGFTIGGSAHGPQTNPNSAVLFFNQRYDAAPIHATASAQELAHSMLSEFRGHAWAQVTDPNGTQIKSWFYQGDAGCTPIAEGKNIATYNADPCFVSLREREFLKGKEYKTEVFGPVGAGSPLLKRIERFYTVQFDPAVDYGLYPLSGTWHSFNYERQTVEKNFEPGSSNSIGKITDYYYDPAQQGGVQYGNLTKIDEWDAVANFQRQTLRWYMPTDNATTYIVDKAWQERINGTGGVALALSHSFYDNTTSTPSGLTKGELKSTRRYFNLPANADLTGSTISGTDTSYTYDIYGNPKETITYNDAGITTINSSYYGYSAPGNGSLARKSTINYDPKFNTYPVQISQVVGNQTLLSTTADYWYLLGVLTSIVDPNNKQTQANYDVFGRLHKIAKPGDTLAAPTIQANYNDTEIPFRYEYRQLETAGNANSIRITNLFYDGLGRQIQSKQESAELSQNIVTDKVYDGLGNIIKTSQPRYVSENLSTFWQYVPQSPDSNIMKWTTTTYDAANRVKTITAPDGGQVNHLYIINPEADGKMTLRHNIIDALRHRSQERYNAFGKLNAVADISGDCDPNNASFPCAAPFTTPWNFYAETFYSYNQLGMLTQVKDAQNNLTTMTYDSLGRKKTMSEPNMGNWSYNYDANNNLTSQTDGKNQTITFGYDGLNRMIGKTLPGNLQQVFNYDEAASTNGKGHLTSAAVPGSAIRYHFTDRGLLTKKVYDGGRTFEWGYDSGDRLLTLKLPSLTAPNNANASDRETLTYNYDSAWRQTGVCGSICYASSASYNALNQLTQFTYGNGLRQDYTYNSLTAGLENSKLLNPDTNTQLYNRSQVYDAVGNVKTINYNLSGEVQNFSYDHLNRLTNANRTTGSGTNVYNETYVYDTLGNITSKANVVYQYKTDGNNRPYTPSRVGGQLYEYDLNGNLTQGGGRAIGWNAENMPISVISTGSLFTAESYTYNAEGKRSARTRGGQTTYYFEGLLEEDTTSKRISYNFAGKAVAQRSSTGDVTYLHHDHLGSVTKVTDANKVATSNIDYDPWGKVRSGTTAQTSLNYTGQRLDDTGLLYYNARYYDPALGRFISPDTINPDPTQNKTRNRYSYVSNNPINFTDPTGHCGRRAAEDEDACNQAASDLANYGITINDTGEWLLEELLLTLEATMDMARAAGWSADQMKNALTNGGRHKILFKRVDRFEGPGGNTAGSTSGRDWFGTITVNIYNRAFSYAEDGSRAPTSDFKLTVVHEIAHAWDNSRDLSFSDDMMEKTGSYYKGFACGIFECKYESKGAASEYGAGNHRDDWAEAVTASVYPTNERYTDIDGNPRMNETRAKFVQEAFANART